MDFETFSQSVSGEGKPPAGLSTELLALWQARRGDWEGAHQLAQKADSREGDWVHAYLHRVEGDEANSAYWYTRAGKKKPDIPLDTEWVEIAKALCAGS